MWSGNMAARWRGKDGDLNAGNSEFLCCNTPDELCRGDVEMDPQSCVDQSILAIFEDSAVSSEDKSGAEEESETLLTALTEMLDSVEDDDDTTLSPFDTLPDTKLLSQQENGDKSEDVYLADRLRPRSKSPNLTFTMKSVGEKEEERKVENSSLSEVLKQHSQTLFHPNNKKTESEVEVFTSTSLVNLVKLMHPYCLKLHVEEAGNWESTTRPSAWDKPKKRRTLFSQEEVWKYQRPTEDSDEEINVVSDDEAPAKEMKQADEKRDDAKPLKSVLLNGSSPRAASCREKKRVSFGPVQVAAFEESPGKDLSEKNRAGGATVPKALGNPSGTQTEPSSETSGVNDEAPPQKADTKAKALSLQQYRQLRQKRRPLVEKQRNYTTKWPSVSEAPKELTPFLCLHEKRPKAAHRHSDCTRIGADPLQRPSSHRTAPPPRPGSSEVKTPSRVRSGGSKCPKTEPTTISPASPHVTADAESKKSPTKKPKLHSSDPPNPVLLPMPVPQPPSPTTTRSAPESAVELLRLETTSHRQEIHNDPTAPPSETLQSTSEPKSGVLPPRQDQSSLLQEIKNKLTEMVSDISSKSPLPSPAATGTGSDSVCKEPQPQKYNLNPLKDFKLGPKTPQTPFPDPVRDTKCPFITPHSTQTSASLNSPTSPEAPSCISAPEEPPPSLQPGCREQSAAGGPGIEAPDLTSLLEQFEETQAKEEEECELDPKFVSAAPPPNLHRTQPIGTENPSKHQPPPPVAPLKPSKATESPRTAKTNQTLELADIPEPLGTEVILSTQQAQPARRKTPPSKAIQIIDPRPLPSKKANSSTSEFPAAHIAPHLYSSVSSDHDYCAPAQVTALDSTDECRKQASTREADASVDTSKPVARRLSENHGARSEADLSAEIPDSAAASEQDSGGASGNTADPCTLPTPPPSPPSRGREKRRYRRRSPRSDSSSSSCSSCSSSSSSASRSPKRPRLHPKRSESSSWSSSSSRSVSRSPPRRRYRLSHSRRRYSRSRSRSWSHSRSRSRSPSSRTRSTRWRDVCSSREARRLRREQEMRIQKLKAIDERRVVYVGRISRSMTHDELRQRFSQFGEVECVSLHFRDRGDHYGFVTFYNMKDAFAAIDNGGKLRRPDELPFDICFGGRRQFCNSNYADLDANRDADASPTGSKFDGLDFDSLLKQAQRGIKR